MKYYDYGPYGDSNEPDWNKEKTDNDVEAMKALDEAALSVNFDAIKNQVAALQNQSSKRRPVSGERQVEPSRSEPQTVRQDFDAEQTSLGGYWDTYFSDDGQKTSNPEPIAAADVPEEDDTYYPISDIDFVSGTEKEEDETETPAKKGEKGTLLSLFQKRKAAATPSKAATEAQTEEMLAAPRQLTAIRKYGLIGAASVVALVLIGIVVIAEPWVPAAVDDYEEPQPVALGAPITLEVGQTYTLAVTCGQNEAVYEVFSEENDILSVMDNDVQAHGEWDSVKVYVKTIEKEVPAQPMKEFKLLGTDMTVPYNQLRSNLRAFFGVEPKTPPRTEKRIVSVYEQEFHVSGYEVVSVASPINLYTQDYYEMTILHADYEEVIFTYEGKVIEVEKTVRNEDGYVTYLAKSTDITGKGKIIATTGFYKNDIFVPTGAMTFDVEVMSRPQIGEQAVFTSGNYNGNIVIEQGDGSSGQS